MLDHYRNSGHSVIESRPPRTCMVAAGSARWSSILSAGPDYTSIVNRFGNWSRLLIRFAQTIASFASRIGCRTPRAHAADIAAAARHSGFTNSSARPDPRKYPMAIFIASQRAGLFSVIGK